MESNENSSKLGAVWTEGETLLLLEYVLKHGDDWELVAQNVQTKTKLDCISKLIELPFGELILGSAQRNGNSNSGHSAVNNAQQLQSSLSDHKETSKTEDQLPEHKNENEQNGDIEKQAESICSAIIENVRRILVLLEPTLELHDWDVAPSVFDESSSVISNAETKPSYGLPFSLTEKKHFHF